MSNSDVEVRIGGDSKDLAAAMQEATASVNSGVASITSAMAGMAAAFVSFEAIRGIATSVIHTASSFEQLDIQLKAVMGSAEAGQYAFQWIKDFAVATPYSVESTTKAFMQLKNFGLDPMDGTLQKVADASAKYGRGMDTAERVTLALGQAWARGKLQGQDTLQMIDAGIPVYDLLSKAIGKPVSELQQMSEKGELTRSVMRKLIDEMGKDSFGTSEAKMHSIAGAASNLGDAYANAIDNIRQKGGFSFITDSLEKMTAVIPDTVNAFATMGGAVGDAISTLWDGFKEAFGAIADIIRSVFGAGGEGVTTTEFFINVIRVVTIAVLGLKLSFQEAFGAISIAVGLLVNSLITFADIADKAFHLDWEGTKAAWKQGTENAKRIVDDGLNDMMKKAEETQAAMNKVATGEADERKGKKPETEHKPDPVDKKKETKGDDRLAQYKRELQEKKDAETDFFASTAELERKHWEAKLELVKTNSKKDVKLRQQIHHEIWMLDKQAAVEQRKLADATLEEARKMAKDEASAKADGLALKKDLGMISAEEELAGLRRIKEEEYQIEYAALQEKLKLYEEDAVQKRKVQASIEEVTRQHSRELSKIEGDMLRTQKRNLEELLAPVTQAVQTSVNGMIMGTVTWQKALSNIFQSILGEFVAMGTKKLAAHIVNQHMETAATAAGATARTGIETTAASQKMAISGGASIANIMNSAWEAMAGAYKAIAGIPYVGPALAPVAAGAAFAGVAMMASNVLSAEGGFDIPAGVNPMVQTHQKEMILPAKYADVIRGMAGNGGAGGGGGGGLTVHVNAIDSRGVAQFFNQHGAKIVDTLHNQRRSFNLPNK